MIRLRDSPTVTLVGGSLSQLERLADIPLEEGVPAGGTEVRPAGRRTVPAGHRAGLRGPRRRHAAGGRRHRDRAGGPARRAGRRAPRRRRSPSTDEGGFETSDEDYAAVVERIIRDEIGNGEGANLVVGRHYRAQLSDWDADRALTVLRRLLTSERGAYWTYCFWTGDRFLIGASPERHVSVHGGDVRMNPISGTFRLRGLEPSERKQRLLEFLADEKEIFELFMVVDEELKMMCDICHEGGQVLGPVPQADDPPRAHRVPPRRPHPLRRARRAARHDVRRHGDRGAGGERLPADPRVRVRGPRLLRRRPRADRPRRARAHRPRTHRS